MYRSQRRNAEFVSFSVADKVLEDSDEVIVVEINGDARAYPDLFITQPHVVGDVIGGEEIAMTYCGLSHLGMAYSPYLDGRRLDLKVMSQIENNLYMAKSRGISEYSKQLNNLDKSGLLAQLPRDTDYACLHPHCPARSRP